MIVQLIGIAAAVALMVILLVSIVQELRKPKSKSVPIPLMVGRGGHGELVGDLELSQEEAALIITATKMFVAEMEAKYGPLYLPTSTEQAQADIVEEDNREWDEAMSLTYRK